MAQGNAATLHGSASDSRPQRLTTGV